MIQKVQSPFPMLHSHYQIASYCHMLLDILHGSVGELSGNSHSKVLPKNRKLSSEVEFGQLVKDKVKRKIFKSHSIKWAYTPQRVRRKVPEVSIVRALENVMFIGISKLICIGSHQSSLLDSCRSSRLYLKWSAALTYKWKVKKDRQYWTCLISMHK